MVNGTVVGGNQIPMLRHTLQDKKSAGLRLGQKRLGLSEFLLTTPKD